MRDFILIISHFCFLTVGWSLMYYLNFSLFIGTLILLIPYVLFNAFLSAMLNKLCYKKEVISHD